MELGLENTSHPLVCLGFGDERRYIFLKPFVTSDE
jgi:hypothetical protein